MVLDAGMAENLVLPLDEGLLSHGTTEQACQLGCLLPIKTLIPTGTPL
jgi:hypothetical protein